MNSSELEIYEQLKPKLGEKETRSLFNFIESKVEKQQNNLATKLDLEKVRTELKDEIGKVKAELLLVKWMLGAVLACLISLVLKAFFI